MRADCRTRWSLSAAIAVAVLSVAACAKTTAVVPLPSRAAAQPREIVGWWFLTSNQCSSPTESIEVLGRDGRLRFHYDLEPLARRTLESDQGSFVCRPTESDDRRLEVWLTADRMRLCCVWTQGGQTLAWAEFERGIPARIKNEVTDQNMYRLENAIGDWSARNGAPPPVSVVQPDNPAFAASLDPWPTNPFTDEPVAPGQHKGEYLYRVNGASWSLSWMDASGCENAMGSNP